MKIRPILIVEDDELQRRMLGILIKRKFDIDVSEAENGRVAIDMLARADLSALKLVVMDLDMPIMGGLETLEIIKQQYPHVPVLMLTGSKDVEDAVAAMKRGAVDFVSKPYEGERMAVTIRNALKLSSLSREVNRLSRQAQNTFNFEHVIGHDGGLLEAVMMGRKAASSDIPVLLTGETGAGKEVFARAIHGDSRRSGKAFVAVNCGAIPAQLVESTLFGHEKGAFTGATDKKIGKFREAEGGTIFLDEVGELPLDTQVKLLRVLQQKEVEPVGAGQPVPVNVRIISATNRSLNAEVGAQRFREDLFFRLNVLPIVLPALRDRLTDVPALAHHFIERICAQENIPVKTLSEAALDKFMAYDWPGNVRQLENVIARAVVLQDGMELQADDFSFSQNSGAQSKAAQAVVAAYDMSIALQDDSGGFKSARDIEQEAIQKVLAHLDGNVTQAAKALNIAKSTFYKKIGQDGA